MSIQRIVSPSRAVACLLAMLAAGGCGQTGPLYLPGNPSQVQTPATTGGDAVLPEPEDDTEDIDDNDEQGY